MNDQNGIQKGEFLKVEVWLELTETAHDRGSWHLKSGQVKSKWKFGRNQAGIAALNSGFFSVAVSNVIFQTSLVACWKFA